MIKFLFKISGWKISGGIPPEIRRSIIICAPHTSNWDFYFAMLVMKANKIPCKFAIKEVFTKFPLGLIFNPLGAIGINRKKANLNLSYVDLMAEQFSKYTEIGLLIAPEGSRSLRKQWKSGFFHVAKAANIPIVSAAADFAKKEVTFGPVYKQLSNFETLMKDLMPFYKDVTGKFPENFSQDERFI